MEIMTVKLADISGDDNRKYTRDDGFRQLVSSIKVHGVIEHPVLRDLGDGNYRIIAGRRRVAALRELKAIDVECSVYAANVPVSEEEIALAENVNRLDMHPLDEAALFSSMAARGAPVGEIAKYYARSPSAIYKRLRLATLIDELKGMFRDGRLDITGAAMLAELPEEDQKEFYNKEEFTVEKGKVIVDRKIEIHTISQFIYKKQKNIIEESMKKICKGCKKRTHNEDAALFEDADEEEEYGTMDVCLDGECYRAKWNAMISAALEAQIVQAKDAGLNTDEKIFMEGGAPERLFKNASKMLFKINKKEMEFEALRANKYDFTGETNRKKDACWRIYAGITGKIDVRRVGYREKPPKEKQEEKGNGGGKETDKNIKNKIEQYGREAAEVAAKELQLTPGELVKELENKKIYGGGFEDLIMDLIIERVTAERIEKESGEEPPREYFEMLMQMMDEECFSGFPCSEKEFNEEQKKWWGGLFGNKTIKQVSAGLGDDANKLLHFMLLTIGFRCVTTLDKLKKLENPSDDLFIRYTGMDAKKYTELYLQTAKEVAAAALKPKKEKYLPGHNPKSALGRKKKAELKKKTAPEVSKELKDKFDPDEPEDDDDNYPFGPAADEDYLCDDD